MAIDYFWSCGLRSIFSIYPFNLSLSLFLSHTIHSSPSILWIVKPKITKSSAFYDSTCLDTNISLYLYLSHSAMTKASLTTFDSSQIRATNRDGGAAPVARRKTAVLHKQRRRRGFDGSARRRWIKGKSQPLFAVNLAGQALSISLQLLQVFTSEI